MLNINITATGIDTIQYNLDKGLRDQFADSKNMAVFFNKYVEEGVIPGIKKGFQKRGYSKKWPEDFQPGKDMENLLTKKQNYKIVTRKDSVRITPKKIVAVEQKEITGPKKRGSEMSDRKRGSNEIAIVKDGMVKITKLRGSGKNKVDVVSLPKDAGNVVGGIFKKWLKGIKFKK